MIKSNRTYVIEAIKWMLFSSLNYMYHVIHPLTILRFKLALLLYVNIVTVEITSNTWYMIALLM